jgi:hypothetical protein
MCFSGPFIQLNYRRKTPAIVPNLTFLQKGILFHQVSPATAPGPGILSYYHPVSSRPGQ